MRLALFFSKGVSLAVWDKVGMLDREIKPYQELAKHFEEIFFLTYGGKNDLKYQDRLAGNIKIVPNKFNLPPLLYSFLMPLFCRKELKKADIFKTNQLLGAWAAVIAKYLFKKKLVVRFGYQWSVFSQRQGLKSWKIPLVRFLEGLACRKADKVILASLHDKNFTIRNYGISEGKIILIPNYIDTDLFRPLGLAEEERICFVGRLTEQKNVFNLIRAVAGIGIKIIIFGSGSQKQDLKNLAKELGVKVEFRGNISNKDLPAEINKSRIFILPSIYEGCPKALLEAMACALPVIGTNVEGIKDIIIHKENGYLAETSAESLGKAIKEVLNDKNLQIKISQGARETILDKFNLEKILENEIRVYKNL